MSSAWQEGWGAACVRGLPQGAASRPFSAAHLVRALRHLHHRDTHHSTVYVDVDAAGFLVARGVGAGGADGDAELCVRAELAPHVQARTAALCLAPAQSSPARAGSSGAGVLLQLVVERARAPHEPLRLWPDERVARLLRLPHLAPHHILDSAQYRCGACGARFEDPNPLKVHLFLGCAPPDPARFWQRVAACLAPFEEPAMEVLSPARLETLAAAWGRGRGDGGAHACLYCGKVYSRAYGLKIHIRTHTGHRPLRCRMCARAFSDPSNLNKHVRLHAARDRSTDCRDTTRHNTTRHDTISTSHIIGT